MVRKMCIVSAGLVAGFISLSVTSHALHYFLSVSIIRFSRCSYTDSGQQNIPAKPSFKSPSPLSREAAQQTSPLSRAPPLPSPVGAPQWPNISRLPCSAAASAPVWPHSARPMDREGLGARARGPATIQRHRPDQNCHSALPRSALGSRRRGGTPQSIIDLGSEKGGAIRGCRDTRWTACRWCPGRQERFGEGRTAARWIRGSDRFTVFSAWYRYPMFSFCCQKCFETNENTMFPAVVNSDNDVAYCCL